MIIVAMPIALRPFPTLSPAERLHLFNFVRSFEPTRFATFDALREDYTGTAFDHGRQHYSLWDNGRLRGTIALVTLEVASKGEAYLVSAYVREGDREAFDALVGHALAECPTRPLPFKLGLAPSAPYMADYARDLGFEEDDAALVLTLDPAATLAVDEAVSWEPLSPANRETFQAIWNATLAASPNGGSLTDADVDDLLATQAWAGLFTLNGPPVGVAQLAVRQEVGWIEAIAIAPAHRGQGLGRPLVGACVAQLRAQGASSIRLLVMRSNEAAVRLYRKVGFGRDEVKGLWWRRTVEV